MHTQVSNDYMHELSVTAHIDASDAADYLQTFSFPVCSSSHRRHTMRKETLSMPAVSDQAPVKLWSKDYVFDIIINFLVYSVHFLLMLWSTAYAIHTWNASISACSCEMPCSSYLPTAVIIF